MTKTKITTSQAGYVTLQYEDAYSGEIDTREFMVPVNGGYVFEQVNDDWKQVCDRLSTRGSTLMCSSPAKLINVIRREYKAMRAAEKREADR